MLLFIWVKFYTVQASYIDQSTQRKFLIHNNGKTFSLNSKYHWVLFLHDLNINSRNMTTPEGLALNGPSVYFHYSGVIMSMMVSQITSVFIVYSTICSGADDKKGKSEGFESCDRPIVRKRPISVKMGDVLSRVTLKFDGWPWKTIGHLSFVVSSFVQHFIAIGDSKRQIQSGNAQFGSNSTIFRAVWPCNLTYDLEKQ